VKQSPHHSARKDRNNGEQLQDHRSMTVTIVAKDKGNPPGTPAEAERS
jgi:hypothetical protein